MSLKDPLNTDEPDWSAPEHAEHKSYSCRSCGEFLGSHGVKFWNGWPWCPIHYRQMVALSMEGQDLRELEGQEQAARQDIERDDFVDEMNRSRR